MARARNLAPGEIYDARLTKKRKSKTFSFVTFSIVYAILTAGRERQRQFRKTPSAKLASLNPSSEIVLPKDEFLGLITTKGPKEKLAFGTTEPKVAATKSNIGNNSRNSGDDSSEILFSDQTAITEIKDQESKF